MNAGDSDRSRPAADEAWKAQVAREREAARETMESEEEASHLPPASLEAMIHMLATQAMGALGMFEGPEGGAEVDQPVAKLMIDLLGVLETKTAGNRTENESELLSEVQYQLRMAYVQVTQELGGASEPPKSDKPKIILP